MSDVDDLIAGITILRGYTEYELYLAAELDQIYLGGPRPSAVSEEDRVKLDKLCVWWDEDIESWYIFV